MNQKKKVLLYTLTHIALTIMFIGYYFSLYTDNKNNISTYTKLILILVCGSTALFSKQKIEHKILNTVAKVNGVLFAIWAVTIIVQLFI